MDTLRTLIDRLNQAEVGDIIGWTSDGGETVVVGKGKKCWHFGINGEMVGAVERNQQSRWECWKAGDLFFVGLYNYAHGYEWSACLHSPRGMLEDVRGCAC